MRIGVLALQGAFAEHVSVLRAIGVEAVEVRLPAQVEDIDGLILPGRREHDDAPASSTAGACAQPILDLAARGAPAVRDVRRDDRPGDARSPAARSPSCRCWTSTVERNAFGRQLDSFETELAGAAPGRHAGPRGVHPRPRDRARGRRRRRPGDAARRADRRRARAERHRDLVPPGARGRDALPPPRGDDGRRARRPGRGRRAAAAPHASHASRDGEAPWPRARARSAPPG